VLVVDARAISSVSAELVSELAQLRAAPDSAHLTRARAAHKQALLVWQRGIAFPHGPLLETSALVRAAFWPTRRAELARLIQAPQPLDLAAVHGLGVDLKGLYAIEELLFAAPGNEPNLAPWVLGPDQTRALQFAWLAAQDVQHYADDARTRLGDGARLAHDWGRDPQAVLNKVVPQLLKSIDAVARRVANVLGLPRTHTLAATAVQGGPSGLSTELVSAVVEHVRSIYGVRAEATLSELVRALSPAIDERLRALLRATLGALRALASPLEASVRSDPARLQSAFDSLKALEVALRADLASVLGVTITFTSSDGD
jgi:predicted lipoprotein